MAAPPSYPDITLRYPYVAILASVSVLDGTAQDADVVFGQVVVVNDLSDSVSVNDYVTYSKKNQIQVIYDNIMYSIIPESDIIYKENYITPP